MRKKTEQSADDKTQPEVTKEKIRKTLRLSIKDAGWGSLMAGFGEFYLPALAVFLQATSLQISLLSSLPQLLSSALQLVAVRLTTLFKSRKRIVLVLLGLQIFLWLAIFASSIFLRNVWLIILLATGYFTLKEMIIPAWSSWIGDLVHEDKRGRYFGRRNRVAGAAAFAATIVGGIILYYLESLATFSGFAVLFLISFFAGLVTYSLISKEYEPIVTVRAPRPFGFRKFLSTIHKTNFGIFTLYISLMHFATWIVAPLFTIYFLTTLSLSYLQFMILLSAAAVSGFVTMTYWGANADRYGNKTILAASSIMVASLPAFWYATGFMSHDQIYHFAIILQIIGGFAWAGFNLSSSNFIFDSISPKDRVRSFAYYNSLKGMSIFLGGLLGGLLAGIAFSSKTMHSLFPTGFMFLLIVSGVLRLAVHFFFSHRVREIKKVGKHPHFLHFAMVMPMQGLILDSVVGMNRTIKSFRIPLHRISSTLDIWENDFKKKVKKP